MSLSNTFFSIGSFYFILFYCILGLGVHVQNMQDSCIGTHMAVCYVNQKIKNTYVYIEVYIYIDVYINVCVYTHTHTHGGGRERKEFLQFGSDIGIPVCL